MEANLIKFRDLIVMHQGECMNTSSDYKECNIAGLTKIYWMQWELQAPPPSAPSVYLAFDSDKTKTAAWKKVVEAKKAGLLPVLRSDTEVPGEEHVLGLTANISGDHKLRNVTNFINEIISNIRIFSEKEECSALPRRIDVTRLIDLTFCF